MISNNIREILMLGIGIGINLWHQYQWIDLWRVYLWVIRKLFANIELFAEHCDRLTWFTCLVPEWLVMISSGTSLIFCCTSISTSELSSVFTMPGRFNHYCICIHMFTTRVFTNCLLGLSHCVVILMLLLICCWRPWGHSWG